MSIKANGNIVLSEHEKQIMISEMEAKFRDILTIMKYDVNNDQQIKDTPKRIAKMWVNDLFKGNYEEEPLMTTFKNEENINDMVFLGPISIKSTCSHHFIPFIGNCYVAYIPNDEIVGISKLARVVKWFMRRPQIQEELVKHIADYIEQKLSPKGVAVYVEAQHLCMTVRGVEESNSFMKSSAVRGVFLKGKVRKEFFDMIKD